MNWDINNIENIVEHINSQLKNRSMTDIEKNDFNVERKVIARKLYKIGYILKDKQYVLKDNGSTLAAGDIIVKDLDTHNITHISNNINADELKANMELRAKTINMEVYNLNKQLIEMLTTQNNVLTNIIAVGPGEEIERSFIFETASYRIDTGIQKRLKEISNKHLITLKDLVNNALFEYLQKFDK